MSNRVVQSITWIRSPVGRIETVPGPIRSTDKIGGGRPSKSGSTGQMQLGGIKIFGWCRNIWGANLFLGQRLLKRKWWNIWQEGCVRGKFLTNYFPSEKYWQIFFLSEKDWQIIFPQKKIDKRGRKLIDFDAERHSVQQMQNNPNRNEAKFVRAKVIYLNVSLVF